MNHMDMHQILLVESKQAKKKNQTIRNCKTTS